ncbi:alpha/beta fold hydrolase [Sandaracinus amylolyticus]|uniref:alpha/beta fold hydrolase n=1 Tax=Sandaracinus amylolyticus TaxID=927083 RepID=UPI001F4114F6|nr:alpha/beta fold hydrolase [Sandaracinus amylolyticus]UJR81398.1 AB hydrolase-1 domain-containing protein [Sandaracinus amylolyticus]
MQWIGALAGRIEDAFGHAWSLGEIGLALTRLDEILRDPHHRTLHDDVTSNGFHTPFDDGALDLALARDGSIHGTNPYQRVCGSRGDRVMGWLERAPRNPGRRLLVICHCYGVPSPRVMRRLFGLRGLDVDVVTNVMGHHQPGTYPAWPGSGLVSARLSRFVENLRCAVTGVRALVRWLRIHEGYERVAVVGFSIGGQLALHLAHAGEVDDAVLYCPVTSLATTARELGLMRHVSPLITPALERFHGSRFEELLALADPLSMHLAIDEERMHVIAQRHDALARLAQIEAIRRKYPRVKWTLLPGTHLLPLGLGEVRRAVRDALVR